MVMGHRMWISGKGPRWVHSKLKEVVSDAPTGTCSETSHAGGHGGHQWHEGDFDVASSIVGFCFLPWYGSL